MSVTAIVPGSWVSGTVPWSELGLKGGGTLNWIQSVCGSVENEVTISPICLLYGSSEIPKLWPWIKVGLGNSLGMVVEVPGGAVVVELRLSTVAAVVALAAACDAELIVVGVVVRIDSERDVTELIGLAVGVEVDLGALMLTGRWTSSVTEKPRLTTLPPIVYRTVSATVIRLAG